MLAMADQRTLAEDWLVRRQRLAASETVPEQHRQAQLQVLDYLIHRYGDSAEAARPARFTLAAEFFSNDRVIVVHQHLGRGKIAGVRSQRQANQRVGEILKHLRSVHDDDAVPAHNDFASWINELDQRPEIPSAWRDLWRQLKKGPHPSIRAAISAALEQSPYLPRAALAYLCRCLSDPRQPDMLAEVELLQKCRTETTPVYAARAWLKRIDAGCNDAVTRTLRSIVVRQPTVPDGIREQLADANLEVRLAAIDVLQTREDAMFFRTLFWVWFVMMAVNVAAADDTRVFEMRAYWAPAGKLEGLHARFREHTMKLFEKHGMTNVGYWVPLENAENKLIYFLAYPSREAREKSWQAFRGDPEWQRVQRESEIGGKLVDKVESRFLQATDYSPAIKPSQEDERVFELRRYTTTPGNLTALHDRFRDHTMKLFAKHGMTNVAYWTLLSDQEGADRTLIYILAHASKEAADKSFAAFRSDPDWIAARNASEQKAGGPLTEKDGVKSVYMKATDYSPIR